GRDGCCSEGTRAAGWRCHEHETQVNRCGKEVLVPGAGSPLGHKFKRQFLIGRYIVDFVCLEARLVVELDGGQHADQAAYDEVRDTFLKARGFRVLRFWNLEFLTNQDGVLETLLCQLEVAPRP